MNEHVDSQKRLQTVADGLHLSRLQLLHRHVIQFHKNHLIKVLHYFVLVPGVNFLISHYALLVDVSVFQLGEVEYPHHELILHDEMSQRCYLLEALFLL